MNNFDEYEITFVASVAIGKGEKINLARTLEVLTRRLQTEGYEKYIVGNTHINAIHEPKLGD